MYQALYRKYRPSNFNEIAGQKIIVKTLKNAILNDRLSHAYLFTGPRGTGKTSIAKIVAKTINCESLVDFVPCNNCKSCIEFNSKNDVDIIEIDAASNNGVDEIREIRNKVDLVPSFSKYKVYIIDEVHMLTQGAFNALLKTLEEPPSHVIFILATTEPHKIPSTILSRCQRFDFKRISNDDIVNRLRIICNNENINIEDCVLNEIAKLSDGGLRDSISLLDQVISYCDSEIDVKSVHDVNGTLTDYELKKLFDDIIRCDLDNIFLKIKGYIDDGRNLVKIVENLIDFVKKILLYDEAFDFLKNNSDNVDIYSDYKLGSSDLIKCINEFNSCLNSMKISSNVQLTFEMCLISIINNIFSKKEIKEKENCLEEKRSVNNDLIGKKDNASNLHKNSNLNLLKKIRVNNTLARFDKSLLKDLNFNNLNLQEFVLDSKYCKCASLLLDGKLKAASNEYLIFVFDNNDVSNNFNNNIIQIEELIFKIFNFQYKVVSVSSDEWEKIKYLFNVKKHNFIYKEEDGQFYKEYKQNDDDEIATIFDDIVEYN